MDTVIIDILVKDTKLYPKLYMRTATLYYLRIVLINNTIVYKLGYTTTSIQERVYGRIPTYKYRNGKRLRVAGHIGLGLPTGAKVYIISSYTHRNGSYIYQLEQILHKRYAKYRYIGINILANGNTELYTMDILNLDN